MGNVANLQPHNEQRSTRAKEFASGLSLTLKAYQAAGMTQRAMVEALNKQGTKTARGGEWSLVQLQRVLQRLG